MTRTALSTVSVSVRPSQNHLTSGSGQATPQRFYHSAGSWQHPKVGVKPKYTSLAGVRTASGSWHSPGSPGPRAKGWAASAPNACTAPTWLLSTRRTWGHRAPRRRWEGQPWLRSPLLAMPRQHTLGRVTPWGLVPRWVRAAQGTGHRRATGGQPSSGPGPPPQCPEHKAGETPGLRVTFGIMQASHLPPPACPPAFLDRKQKVNRNGHQMTVQEGSREPGRWGGGGKLSPDKP